MNNKKLDKITKKKYFDYVVCTTTCRMYFFPTINSTNSSVIRARGTTYKPLGFLLMPQDENCFCLCEKCVESLIRWLVFFCYINAPHKFLSLFQWYLSVGNCVIFCCVNSDKERGNCDIVRFD